MRVRKIAEDGVLYKQRRREVIEAHAPLIEDCTRCGSPRHHMYACTYCGSDK